MTKQTGSATNHNGPSRRAGNQQRKQGGPPEGSRRGENVSNVRPYYARRLTVGLCVGLALATVAVYAQVYRFGFIAYDDDQYVYENANVVKGISSSGTAWAFSTYHWGNWHPLTWLSHMLDCELFGVEAGGHHLVNLGFHVANTLLLFLAFGWMTGRLWRSAVVAGVFALHPLHVESVAWVAERKDVLSTFLGLIALLFYIRYAKKRSVARYMLVVLFFGLGLMAKPMLVTLPFVLLLMDVWPLGRAEWPPTMRSLKPLVVEKLPLLLMAVGASVVTVIAQKSSGAVQSLANLSPTERIGNACIGYVRYMGKAVWPVELGVLYPIGDLGVGDAVGSGALLIVLTVGVLLARRRPYVAIGWMWYIGMLVPVIGVVQVGAQSIADRYTYMPLVGLAIGVVWLVGDLVEGRGWLQRAAVVVGGVVLAALGVQAHRQAGYWESSRTLFEHTLAVTRGNYIIHNNLGVVLAREGRFDDAVENYQKAMSFNGDYAEAHANLGHELMRVGKLDEAYEHLAKAVEALPKRPEVQSDMGTLLAAQGRFEESREHLEESIRLAPEQADAHSNLSFVLQRLGRLDEAIRHCKEALRLKPGSVDAHYNMGMALAAQGKRAEAAAELTKALELNAGHAGARAALEALRRQE